MAAPALEPRRVVDAVDDVLARYDALLRQDLDAGATAVGHWSVTEVATHVRLMAVWVRNMLAGEPSPFVQLEGFGERSQQLVDAYEGDRALPALADGTVAQLQACLADIAAAPRDEEVVWHAGIRLPVACVAAIVLGELIVHGFDIASANRLPWPIDPAHAAMVFVGVLPLLPHYVDEEAAATKQATYELRVSGVDPVRLRFDRGALTVDPLDSPDDGSADCRITARPVAFLLVSYGRMHPLRPALTGQIRAGGRKPWLALTFNRLLRNP